MSDPTPRRRGRPRRHDPEEALRKVIPAFWSGGYDATSLDTLAKAAGLNRPSLYAALGDKRAMYLAAVNRMRETVMREGARQLDAHDDLGAALRAFYDGAIELYVTSDDEHQRGCLIMCTGATAAYDDPEIAEAVRATVDGLEEILAARFRRAGKSDAEARARLAGGMLHSMAIRARAGVSPDELRRYATETVGLLV